MIILTWITVLIAAEFSVVENTEHGERVIKGLDFQNTRAQSQWLLKQRQMAENNLNYQGAMPIERSSPKKIAMVNSIVKKLENHRYSSPNILGLEFGGRGLFYSLFYEYHLHSKINFGVGYGYVDPNVDGVRITVQSLPVYFNYYFNMLAHRFFIGPGFSTVKVKSHRELSLDEYSDTGRILHNKFRNKTVSVPHLTCGFEYRSRGGTLARVSLSQHFLFAQEINTNSGVSMLGVSLGSHF